MNWLAGLILQSAEKEYSRATKSFFTTWGLVLFELLVPAGLLASSLALDSVVPLEKLREVQRHGAWPLRLAVFAAFLAVGQAFVLWTLAHQLRHSGGTPAFKAPPKRLLTAGPYELCRNPMVLGYLVYYYGLALLAASPTMLFVFVPALNLLALYVTIQVEEVELAERFGEDYLDYKARVGRMLPSWERQGGEEVAARRG